MRGDQMLKREMIKLTALPPAKLVLKYQAFVNKLMGNENVQADLAAWGLKFETKPVKFTGRCLGMQDIMMGSRKLNNNWPAADWTSALKRNAVHVPAALTNWMLLHTRNDAQVARKLAEAMSGQMRNMGCQYAAPKM